MSRLYIRASLAPFLRQKPLRLAITPASHSAVEGAMRWDKSIAR